MSVVAIYRRFGLVFLAVLAVSAVSSAQTTSGSLSDAGSRQSSTSPGYSVSVRELSIPSKAARAFEQGLEKLRKKDPAGSLPFFQRAVAEYPGYFEAYDWIGEAQLELSHLAEAEQAFRKSIDVSAGQFAHPLLALGSIVVDRDQFAEAEALTRKGLALDPNSWLGHYYRSLALLGLNRLTEAEKSAADALHCKPDFPEVHLLLAKIHSNEQNYRGVITDLNNYLILAPDGEASARARAVRDAAMGILIGWQAQILLPQRLP